jgi:hypothetical protein
MRTFFRAATGMGTVVVLASCVWALGAQQRPPSPPPPPAAQPKPGSAAAASGAHLPLHRLFHRVR